jgi:thioredoxin-related protein
MKKVIISIVLIVGLSVSGCASTLNTPENINLVLSKCPTLKSYSKEKMQKAAEEIKNLPDDSQLIEILGDYSRLREACRVAERRLRDIK